MRAEQMAGEGAVRAGVRRGEPVDRLEEARAAALYRRHVPDAVRLAYLMTGDAAAAEDIAHDAFLRAAGRLFGLRSPEAFGAYLRRTVVSIVLSRRRSASREAARSLRARLLTPAPAADTGRLDDRMDLFAVLRTLPPKQRTAIVLRYWADLPEAAIAEAMGCPVGTVKSNLSRGLAALRERVERHD